MAVQELYLDTSSGPNWPLSIEGQNGSVSDLSEIQAEVETFLIRAAIVLKYVSLLATMGSCALALGTTLLNSNGFEMTTSADVRRAEDKGEMAKRAMMLMNVQQIRHQLVLPIDLRLKRRSDKMVHHALGVCSTVPEALTPMGGA